MILVLSRYGVFFFYSNLVNTILINMFLLFMYRAFQCEHNMNEAFDEIQLLKDEIKQLKLERRQFEESVKKDKTEKERAFVNERREHQQLVQQMTGQEIALTTQLMEANRDIQNLNVEKQRLVKEKDDMQDR